MLVLDEVTSALDGDTEASVMEGIEEFEDDVTVLIVAHRLSTLEGCDKVVELGGAPRSAISEVASSRDQVLPL